ncbi:MAG: agmatine deiminase family protein, partial [Gemmatimonadales bacterium]|nr:agmatine deiminase family protein [Gemmatimonadales bacterium]
MRAGQGGRQPDALALSPRPPYRCVPGHHPAVSRLTASPAELGYRMPAEWERHRGTWLSWPHKEASWPDKFGPVPGIFASMVRELADHEQVHINVAGPPMEEDVRRFLADAGADS